MRRWKDPEAKYLKMRGTVSADLADEVEQLNGILRQHVARLMAAADRLPLGELVAAGIVPPGVVDPDVAAGDRLPVVCGWVPDRDFAPQTWSVRGGWVVQVPAGFVEGLRFVARLLAAVHDIADVPRAAGVTSERWAAGLDAVVDQVSTPPPVPLPGVRAGLATSHWHTTMVFTLAHEIGHVVLGHRSLNASPLPDLDDLAPPRNTRTAVEELEADAVGAVLARAVLSDDQCLTGARIFFEVLEAIDEVKVARATTAGAAVNVQRFLDATHPHPAQRLNVVWENLSVQGPTPLLEGTTTAFDLLRGRPPLVRDEAAVSALSSLASGLPPALTAQLWPLDRTGVMAYDFTQLAALWAGDRALAHRCVAHLALEYVAACRARWIGWRSGVTLAVVYSLLRGEWPAGDDRGFDDLLRSAVPDLDDLQLRTELSLNVRQRPTRSVNS